ncbi:MAG: translocation/assembly module TamB domain-containing protein, partial [Bdellovibrionales bacterium]|nr:translocation/assembly module TamB domain-containing protein [Bdellovibrionales bacterium]
YGLWDFDSLQVRGRWLAGRLNLSELELGRSEGVLALEDSFEVALPLRAQELAIPLVARNVSYLDFAGEALKSVSAIKGSFTGRVGLTLALESMKSGLRVGAAHIRPDLTVSGFELNNQVWGKQRPLRRILATKNPFRLKGAVTVRGGDVSFDGSSLEFPTGTLQVSGGLSSASGWDVRGEVAQVDLGEELGMIAELPVVGNGGLKAHIHGKGDGIFFDFDLKQRNARFLNFNFGELEGRVSIDDRNSIVFLDRLAGKMNASRYEVNGSVSIDGKSDDIDLTARFVKTAPDDLFTVFAHQLRNISWIPHGMTGDVDGIARVTGGYSEGIDSLQIRADLRGARLLYKGEFISEISARAGLDRGTIFARGVKAKKYNSEFTGEIQYFRNDEMKYEFSVPRGKVRDLDWVAGLGFPLEGTWEIRGSGSGKWETLRSDTKILLKNLVVRTKPVPPVAIHLGSGKDDVRIDVVSDTKDLALRWILSRGGESSFEVAAKNPELNWVLCAINRKTCSDEALHLRLDGDFRMRWPNGSLKHGTGGGTLRALDATKETLSVSLGRPMEIVAAGGEIRTGQAEFSGTDTKVILSTATALDGERIDWSLRGESSLRILEFVTSLIEEAKGKISLNVNLGGSLSQVNGSGKIDLRDGILRVSGLDAPVEELNGRLAFRGQAVQFEGTQARIGGGEVRLAGGLKLHLDRAPEMGIDLFLSNNRIRFFPVNFAEFDEARLSFSGEKPPYLFGGLARVRRALMKKNFDFGGQKTQRAAKYLPERLGKKSSVYELKIRAVAEHGVVVDNDLLNAEFRGEVSLLNNFEYPQVTARAELVKGVFHFRNTPFTLDHAVVKMPNPEYLDPQFSLGGMANVNGYKVSIFAAGSAENHRISLSSSPGLSQEDILSLLAFGYTGTEARKINPDDKSALTYTEVGSILLDQLKLNKDLQQRGFKISVAPSIRESEANIIRPRTTGGSAAPKVYLKTQVMKNLDASVGSAFGSSQGGNELDATLDYRMGNKASVGAIYEQEPGIQVNEPRRSYGADIKFRWGFK